MTKCKTCRYAYIDRSWSAGVACCDYIGHTGRVRPCPAGDCCTAYELKQVQRRPKLDALFERTKP